MIPAAVAVRPDGAIEHQGMLWKPKHGATATAEEFLAARALFIELHEDADWNPWLREDRSADIEQALLVMDQWRRAEPGFRRMTMKQWEARQARREREYERMREAEAKAREERKQRYDEQRAHARLCLLECQARLEFEIEEVASFRDGSRFPRMQPARRDDEVAKLDESIARLQSEVRRLTAVVDDPEGVVDEYGRLPRERRELSLFYFRIDRERQIRALRERIPRLRAELEGSTDKRESADLRSDLSQTTRSMGRLLAIPPLAAEQMCSECATPNARHGWVTPPFDGPCPAWPSWAARIRKVREMLEAASRRTTPPEPPAPAPQPLAVIPSGLPIAGVIERLAEIQKTYPDAEVRRGRANRWEIWPSRQPGQSSSSS